MDTSSQEEVPVQDPWYTPKARLFPHGPRAINIIRLRGDANIAAAHRAFSYSPTDVLNALTAA
jgi:hypothetical protein